MEINGTSQDFQSIADLNTPSSSLVSDSSKALGRDAFLKLLTVQLQQQDPLKPQDNSAFVAQLAQFSALEQQMATNKGVESLLASQESLANSQLSGLIGKEVVSLGNGLAINDGKTQDLTFMLATDAPTVNITIRNANGQAVDTLELHNVQGGSKRYAWDGLDARGKPLPDGRYTFEIKATASNGNAVTATPMTRGIVDAVTFENGRAELAIGAARITPGEVVSIHEAPESDIPAPRRARNADQETSSYAPDVPNSTGFGALDVSL
jgi:flagellar basal-body rod modification protein FlgD